MLMVTDFWAWKHVTQAPRACVASIRLWRGVDSRRCAHESLKLTGREGGLIIYHGVMLKVELESRRLHSVLIGGLRRKSTESRSLFGGKSE